MKIARKILTMYKAKWARLYYNLCRGISNKMDDIEFLICDIALLWRRVLNQKTKALGISNTERRIIISLERYPGATQVEIARCVDIEPQNLTKPLDKLFAQDLIQKKSDKKDRRINRLFLTAPCKPIIAKIHQIAEEIRPKIIHDISSLELRQMTQNMRNMKNKLEHFL